MTTLDRTHWIAATPDGFDLYTDHNKLIFLFDPLSVVPDLSATSTRKVLRWAVRLNMYIYTCYHSKGDENVWADLLSRWSTTQTTVRRIVRVPEVPSSSDANFEWPSPSAIAKAQEDNAARLLQASFKPTISGLSKTPPLYGFPTPPTIFISAFALSPTLVHPVTAARARRKKSCRSPFHDQL